MLVYIECLEGIREHEEHGSYHELSSRTRPAKGYLHVRKQTQHYIHTPFFLFHVATMDGRIYLPGGRDAFLFSTTATNFRRKARSPLRWTLVF